MTIYIANLKAVSMLKELCALTGRGPVQALHHAMVHGLWELRYQTIEPERLRQIRRAIRNANCPELEVNDFSFRRLP